MEKNGFKQNKHVLHRIEWTNKYDYDFCDFLKFETAGSLISFVVFVFRFKETFWDYDLQ